MKRTISKDDVSAKISELSAKNERIDDYLALLEKWNHQEREFELYLQNHVYDGILGVPPAWIPPHIRDRFFEARYSLFNNTIDTVNKPHEPWELKFQLDTLSHRSGIFENPNVWLFPSNIKDDELYKRDLSYLILLWAMVRKGPDSDLSELIGEDAVRAMDTMRRKTVPLAKVNDERHSKAETRNQRIRDLASALQHSHPTITKKTAIAVRIRTTHPDLVRKEDGHLLSIDAIARILN